MSSSKPNVLRPITEHELDACFCDLSPKKRDDLATSLVRQWMNHSGVAVIVTRAHEFWFRMNRLEDGRTEVVRDVQQGTFVAHLRRSRVIEEEIPALLHELSLCQSTCCYNEDGEMLQLRVDPAQKKFYIELVPDSDR